MTQNLRWWIPLALVLTAVSQVRSETPQYRIQLKLAAGDDPQEVLCQPCLQVCEGQEGTVFCGQDQRPGSSFSGCQTRVRIRRQNDSRVHVELGCEMARPGPRGYHFSTTLARFLPLGAWQHEELGRDPTGRALGHVSFFVERAEAAATAAVRASAPKVRCKIGSPALFLLGQLAFNYLTECDEACCTMRAGPPEMLAVPVMACEGAVPHGMPAPVPCPLAGMQPFGPPMAMPGMPGVPGMAPGCPMGICFPPFPTPPMAYPMMPMVPPPPMPCCVPAQTPSKVRVVHDNGTRKLEIQTGDFTLTVTGMKMKLSDGTVLELAIDERGQIEVGAADLHARADRLTLEGKERLVLEGSVMLKCGKGACKLVPVKVETTEEDTAVRAAKVIYRFADQHLEIPVGKPGVH